MECTPALRSFADFMVTPNIADTSNIYVVVLNCMLLLYMTGF